MHAQIKEVIATLNRAPGGKVFVDLGAGQETPLGKILGKMFYSTRLTDLLDQGTNGGCPHNGGSHSFWMRAEPLEVIAFIELLKETMLEGKYVLSEESRQVAHELSYISQEIHTLRRKV